MRGKLVGITLHPEPAEVVAEFVDVIDHIPSYIVAAVAAPIGLAPRWTHSGRRCDREARRLVDWPRLGAIASPPGRKDLTSSKRAVGDVTSRQIARLIAQVDAEMQPYRQRSIYSTHPELSYYQLNGDKPLSRPKRTRAGLRERRKLITDRLHGLDEILDTEIAGATKSQLLDAAATLWTARRIRAKAATRLPVDPEWDDEGLRIEYVR
jgi:predicted RNase H-like nuclease